MEELTSPKTGHTHAQLKRCESDWHRSVTKSTLQEEQCTLSALFRLPSKGFF